MRLTFLGGTGTVTGSKYLVERRSSKILVDAGLYQGLKALRLRNRAELPFDPASLDAVVLTHAHIDHSGYLPVLVNQGFSGPVFCTDGTGDLCRILLPDAGHLQEEAARFANERGFSRHSPALPLYTREEAVACLASLRPRPYHKTIEASEHLSVRFSPVGHIIGASAVSIHDGQHTLTFSGDVGGYDHPVMYDPEPLRGTDWLVVESTYGNRRHPKTDPSEEIATIVNQTAERGGVILIPAFAVGRTQTVLHLLSVLRRTGRIPQLPIYMDSPMALDATQIFYDHDRDHRLSPEACRQMAEGVTLARTPRQSKAIDARSGPMIVLSASGMATGGRVLHHLKVFAPDPNNTILLVGYQAAGTRGEALLHDVDELKIHGAYVPVSAFVHRVRTMSAHADYRELVRWLRKMPGSPRRTFVTHGEPAASEAFHRRIEDELRWDARIPEYGQTVELI